jgi:DNA-binding transcriptional MocR family regulator
MSAATSFDHGGTRYAQIAEHLGDLIQRGTYSPGDRVPSVRQLSRELGVSMTTVLEAYGRLETRGLIEARPQRGYFVRRSLPALPRAPADSIARSAVAVSCAGLTTRVIENARRLPYGRLGAAVPDTALLPTGHLGRLLRAVSRQDDRLGVHYDVDLGDATLRSLVAQRAHFGGARIGPDEVLITNGATEALAIALRVTCQPGDLVAVETPTYFNHLQLLEHLGLRAIEIPTDCCTGLSIAALELALAEHEVRAVLTVPSFQNPTGGCMAPEDRQRLVALCARHRVPVIEDDIYGEMHFGAVRPPLLKASDADGGVLLCSSVSKSVAPGFRVGWLIAGRWMDQAVTAKLLTTLGSPTVTQEVIGSFMAAGDFDRHLRRIRPVYERRVDELTGALRRHLPAETRITTPSGGMVLWLELPETIDVMKLYEAAVDAGIAFAPGPAFSAKQRYRHHLRLNAACWSTAMEPAIATLGKLTTKVARQGGRRAG